MFLVNSTTADTSILWNLTYLFLGLGLLYFVFILFIKNRLSRKAIKTASKRSELAPIISNFLFHSVEDTKDEQKEYVQLKIEIREYLRDSEFRKILSEILFDLQKDVSGTTEKRLFKLYRELDLHHDAFLKLKSWRWEVVSQGIIELTQMQVSESYQLITKFVNDKRGTIRKQAEIAAIKLRNEGIEHILDSTRYAISEWQQLKMIEALVSLKNYKPPRFKSWLISENKDVVLFALRLIKHYNQNDAVASITQLVKHKSDQIRLAAIQCIKDFNFVEAKTTLRSVFVNCSDEVKIQILGAIALFGDESDIPFLNGIAVKESNFLISSKARSAINSIAPGTVLPTKGITKTKTSGIELEIPLGKKEKPAINPTEETTTISITDEYLEIATRDDTEILEIDDAELVVEDNKEVEKDEVISEETSFDFEEMDVDTNSSIDKELGLLASENDDLMDKNPVVENIEDEYVKMDLEQKDAYLDKIDENIDSNQVELLEMIMEREDESELRFRAFKKFKQLKTFFPVKGIVERELEQPVEESEAESQQIVEESLEQVIEQQVSEIGEEQQSVFYQLYQKANDLDSKLILIEQIESIGDEKEIVFLKTLLDAQDSKIVKHAKATMAALEKRLSGTSKETSEIKSIEDDAGVALNLNLNELDIESYEKIESTELNISFEIADDTENNEEKKDNKLPLELCFLYDEFGIKASEEKDDDFDFELSEDFFLNLKNQKERYEH
ncbi:hypothetical protein [uncultured Croceitalea sp.]|uniref:HEAT repeat domain-containing protein n=1 Tax=uncultured Croceitalea sp. TaxID=1798908 RepID=UPI0033064C32